MPTTQRTFRIVAAVVLGSIGCTTTENQHAPDSVAALSEPSFRCNVEPILARDCSFMACHGQSGAPLRIYSVGKLRAGDSDTLEERLAPLTDAERHANYRSALGFTFGEVSPDDNFLIRKVLPSEYGGYGHRGGAIFSGLDDPRTIALRTWLAGGTSCTP